MGTQTSSVQPALPAMAGAPVADPEAWDEPRWAALLERVEQRQAGIGLRFWGPPLWLEVTMTGPDSEAWSVAGAGQLPDQPWDWQASAACTEAMDLEAAGGDDDHLLEVVSRYTVENLILNAVHEIGEWLRFDAHRLFAAHGRVAAGDGIQGNGAVNVAVRLGATTGTDSPSASAVTARAERDAASWRFTYLPGLSLAYGPWGPVVTEVATSEDATSEDATSEDARAGGGATMAWSDETRALTDAPVADFVEAVQRDVHRLLVQYEAANVCDRFYVDAVRPWFVGRGPGRSPEANAHPQANAHPEVNARPLTLSITYDKGFVDTRPDTDRSSGRPQNG